MARQRPMSPRQQEVARKAKMAFKAKQAIEKMTLQDASRAIGWSDSVLGQYLNANIPMGIEAIAKVANYLNMSPYELDPELAKDLPAQPEDVQALEQSLSLLSEMELERLMRKLAARLPPKDVSRLMEIFLSRLNNSL